MCVCGVSFVLGTKWHKRRKILTPAFHFNILQQFMDIITEETNRISKTPKDTKSIMVEDLLFFTSEHTLNVICGISFCIYHFIKDINFNPKNIT